MTDKKETEITREHLLKDVYTPLIEAKTELLRRRSDKKLIKKVRQFLSNHPVPEIKDNIFAFQSKSIFSPNRELKNFLELAESIELTPMLLEYNGKFVARNFEKYYICKMYFKEGENKRGEFISKAKKIVDFNKEEGNNMDFINTVQGPNLKELHHELLFDEYDYLKNNICNINEWFDNSTKLDDQTYTYFLSLFIVNGILFENYLPGDSDEAWFIKNKLIPGIKRVEELFGLKPLIVPSLPLDSEDSREWYSYEHEILDNFNDIINKA